MDRLYFLVPRSRHEHKHEIMYLIIKPPRNPNIRSARHAYRVLRKSGSSRSQARWTIYDLVSMRTERAGSGYGL